MSNLDFSTFANFRAIDPSFFTLTRVQSLLQLYRERISVHDLWDCGYDYSDDQYDDGFLEYAEVDDGNTDVIFWHSPEAGGKVEINVFTCTEEGGWIEHYEIKCIGSYEC